MGSITLQVVGDGSVGTKVKTYAVSDADINRIVAYGMTLANGQGNTNPTVAQALVAYADLLMQITKGNIVSAEISALQRSSNIVPPTMT